MIINNDIDTVAGCKLLHTHKCVDDRGILCFAEGSDIIPFDIKRIFWIYGVDRHKTRGGHSHGTCTEAIFPVKGKFDITITDGTNKASITLDDPSCGILIPAGIWCELDKFSTDAVCMVAASQHYDAEGYTNNYNEYLKLCK